MQHGIFRLPGLTPAYKKALGTPSAYMNICVHVCSPPRPGTLGLGGSFKVHVQARETGPFCNEHNNIKA